MPFSDKIDFHTDRHRETFCLVGYACIRLARQSDRGARCSYPLLFYNDINVINNLGSNPVMFLVIILE